MAAEVLARYDQPTMTVTAFDQAMVDAASARLAEFGDRVTVRQADATALPFPDRSFDAILSLVMLHHTVEWDKALAEAVRVQRPGGHVVGYDLPGVGTNIPPNCRSIRRCGSPMTPPDCLLEVAIPPNQRKKQHA